MIAPSRLTIGRLAGLAGVHVETVRYYERIGLLPPPPRSEGGHRLYRDEDLRRLAFIRRGRELGFALADIRALLGLMEGSCCTCGEVKTFTERHLEAVRREIDHLRRLENTLAALAGECAGGAAAECPVIDTLHGER